MPVMTELQDFKDLPAFKVPLVRMAVTVTTEIRVTPGTRVLLEDQVSPGRMARTAPTVFVGRRAQPEPLGTTAWMGAVAQPGSTAPLVPWVSFSFATSTAWAG